MPTQILGQEPQHEVAVLLKQPVLATIAAIGLRVAEMLRPVQLDYQAGVDTEQIGLEGAARVEGDRQPLVEAEPSLRLRQRLQPPEQERFGRAARPIDTLGIRARPTAAAYRRETEALDRPRRPADASSTVMWDKGAADTMPTTRSQVSRAFRKSIRVQSRLFEGATIVGDDDGARTWMVRSLWPVGDRTEDLTPLVVEALGKRIEDPAAARLAKAIGKQPFANATPGGRCDLGDRKRLGIEVVADIALHNRNCWPPRKEGRKWVTWVTTVFLYPNYAGSLPHGFDWHMDDATLRAKAERCEVTGLGPLRFVLPSPWPGLITTTTLGDDGRPRQLYLAVMEEWEYATSSPDSGPENCVEDAFLATWCALNGVLRDQRVSPAALSAVERREITPFAFYATALDGLLWSGDVKPELQDFCKAYTRSADESEGSAMHDAQDVFGGRNHFRLEGEARTPDDWPSYDRIAPLFTRRLDEWRRGTTWPRAGTAG